jgi:hypothetical protein
MHACVVCCEGVSSCTGGAAMGCVVLQTLLLSVTCAWLHVCLAAEARAAPLEVPLCACASNCCKYTAAEVRCRYI